MTDPINRPDELVRLQALLATARLERDDLARQLEDILDGPPAPVAGQQHLPLPCLPM
jgi:hypothetical protein